MAFKKQACEENGRGGCPGFRRGSREKRLPHRHRFGLLYGTLWGVTHGDLATVPFVAARFALAGGIAGLLVTTVDSWADGEDVEAADSGWDEPHATADSRSAKDGAGCNGSMN